MCEVIHHDVSIVVVNKPSGLLTVPGKGPSNADCLIERLRGRYPTARIVHRLDRDTSGVIVLALDDASHRHLSRQFELKQVQKEYIAIVHGVLREDRGRIEYPIRKDFDRPPRQKIDPVFGKESITKWKVIECSSDCTRISLEPRTGRSHQLRLHLATIGHPILGDDLYAPPQVLAMSDRLLLHAQSLTINHPATNESKTFVVPCPF